MTIDGNNNPVLSLGLVDKPWSEMKIGNLLVLEEDPVEVLQIHVRGAGAVDRNGARVCDDLIGVLPLIDGRARIGHDKGSLPVFREPVLREAAAKTLYGEKLKKGVEDYASKLKAQSKVATYLKRMA